MVIGIALGVAVVVAIDIANASAERAFELSTEAVSGRTTHQIFGGPDGLDESIYIEMRRQGFVQDAAPVISEYVSSPQVDTPSLQLIGLDPFTEAPFRDYFRGNSGEVVAIGDLTRFLTQPRSILVSSELAERNDLGAGSQIELEILGRVEVVTITSLLEPGDNLSRRALSTLVLADVATLQELTGRIGYLDRIDLILPDGIQGERVAAQIQDWLPDGVRLQSVEARSGAIEQMTRAFRINLTALSLLALIVGLFLIYNTVTFSVVQRRPLFGTLRSLGVTRQEVFGLVMVEAALVGILGAGLGVLLGVLMGQATLRLVTQTINDLFFVVTVRGVQIPVMSLLKGALLGIVATTLTAAPPAWEAASVQPRAALSRSGLEAKASRAVILGGVAGMVLISIGVFILYISDLDLIMSFVGTFSVVIGFAALAPPVTVILMRLVQSPLSSIWGTLGRMAPRDVTSSLSRTAIAIAALMVAVSVTIGVSLMVSSFRYTVVLWLEQTLTGDVYISVPVRSGTQTSVPIDPLVLERLEGWTGIERVDTLRATEVDSPYGTVQVAASSNPEIGGERKYKDLFVPFESLGAALETGSVLVSEPLYNRLNLSSKTGSITLNTDRGPVEFPIAAVYYDYSSPEGVILISQEVYRQFWDDPSITAIALRLNESYAPDQAVFEIQDSLRGLQMLNIRPNQALREEVLEVFDRTFAITGALQLLATTVAFVGVLSALLSLELERGKEFGILRAVGLTVRQIWGLILLETGLMGASAGLLAMPTGYALALILVYIINLRSFGWTLQMDLAASPFLQAFFLAFGAAILAGIYPAWRMGRMREAEAMRME